MKSLPTTFGLTALFLGVSFFAPAEEKPDLAKLEHPVKACLFKVEGKGLQKASYLFGTIHLSDPRVTTLHPRAEAAFKQADALYTEIDMSVQGQLGLVPLLMRKDGKTLSQALGPDLTGKLKETLQGINPALDLTPFEPMKTWVVAATLPLLEMQLQNQTPLDGVLARRALEADKRVGALETAAGQVGTFDKFSEKEMQTMLADTIEMMREDKAAATDSVTRILTVYLTGDTLEIAKLIRQEMARMDSDPEFAKALLKALLDDRNARMAEKAHESMQANPEHSHFFAVGAAHYTGAAALQDLLTKMGYTITPAFE